MRPITLNMPMIEEEKVEDSQDEHNRVSDVMEKNQSMKVEGESDESHNK